MGLMTPISVSLVSKENSSQSHSVMILYTVVYKLNTLEYSLQFYRQLNCTAATAIQRSRLF
jgi:hypothetical protein